MSLTYLPSHLHYRFHHAHLQHIQNGKHIYKLMVNKANLNFCSQALTIFEELLIVPKLLGLSHTER